MIIKIILGILLIGIGYQTQDTFSIILVVEGIILLNWAVFSRSKRHIDRM